MIVPILLGFAITLPNHPEPPTATTAETSFIDASIILDGDLLDWAFVDIDLDGQDEVVLSTRKPGGGRELRFHRMDAKSVEQAPYQTIRALDDIVAWTFADVRPELKGRELVLMTRNRVWSFDPRLASYRDNIAPLCDLDLLYDVPSSRGLPYWRYVLEGPGHERLLLPDRSGFHLLGPNPEAEEGTPPWHILTSFRPKSGWTPSDPSDNDRRTREAIREKNEQQQRLAITVGDNIPPFLGSGQSQSLIEDEFRIQAPAIVDMNGDGRRDMLILDGKALNLHLATEAGIPAIPTRIEALPDYLEKGGQRAALSLVDLDGDGNRDVLGIWREEFDSLKNVQWRVILMRSKPGRLFPEKPTQVLKFEAAELRAVITDIDGDKRPDLAVRRFEIPSALSTVTKVGKLEFKYAQLLYLGGKRGTLERKPALKKEQIFDEQTVRSVLANRELRMDCSGDGIADLVEVRLDGKLGVRRLTKSKGVFGGGTWQMDDGLWKEYQSRGSVTSLTVRDLNGDGLGDIVSASSSVLTIYISQRR